MSQHALVRVRRTPTQEPTQRLLAFQLRQQWFCLPLAIVRRVLPRPVNPDGHEPDLIQLQHENIPILDAATLVYGAVASLPQLPAAGGETEGAIPTQNIVVVDSPQTGVVGLIVDGPPALKRVRQSAFSSVPPLYLQVHQLRGICSVINPDPGVPDNAQLMFLLAIETLIQS